MSCAGERHPQCPIRLIYRPHAVALGPPMRPDHVICVRASRPAPDIIWRRWLAAGPALSPESTDRRSCWRAMWSEGCRPGSSWGRQRLASPERQLVSLRS